MAVRIANIELTGIQAILTDEGQRSARLEIPGGSGSVVQELGRSSAALALEGLMLGEEALEALESLRQKQVKAEPVSFAADIISGADFTDVLIEALNVKQVAGHRNRYWYRLEIREHVEEPESPGAELAGVDAGVEADAASWSGGAVGAAGVIQDPTALPGALEADPGVLDHLSGDDLAGALDGAAGNLDGGMLGRILTAVGLEPDALDGVIAKLKNVEMKDVMAAYNAIKDPSSIPELLANNPGMLDRLGISDLGKAIAEKADSLTGGQFSSVLQTLGKVDPQKVVSLVNDLRSAGSLGELVEKLAGGGVDILKDLTGIDLGPAAALIQGVAGAADFIKAAQEVGDKASALVDRLRNFDPLAAVRAITEGRDEAGGQALAASTAGTAGDIVTATSDLVKAVDKLLTTSTVQAVISLARQVGAQDQVDSVVDLLVSGLQEIDKLLGGIREPLLQLGAISGLLQLTSSLVKGLDRIATASAEDLAALGLSQARDAAGPLSRALGVGRDVLQGGAAVIDSAPSVESIDGLRVELARLGKSLEEYKKPPPLPPGDEAEEAPA